MIHRSLSENRGEFDYFLDQFEHLLTLIYQEDPYSVIVTGDFNRRSSLWWSDDVTNIEGELLEPLTSSFDLHQLVSEPTHFIGNRKSCIGLIFTNQASLFAETEVHPSLDPLCHHNIISGKINIRCPPVPPFNRQSGTMTRRIPMLYAKASKSFPGNVTLQDFLLMSRLGFLRNPF